MRLVLGHRRLNAHTVPLSWTRFAGTTCMCERQESLKVALAAANNAPPDESNVRREIVMMVSFGLNLIS